MSKALASASALGLCVLAAPANASFLVSTYAQNGDEGTQVVEGYNVNTDDYFNYYISPVGAKQFGGCPPSAESCSVTRDGTPDSSSTATASFDRTTLTTTDAGGSSAGSAFARADLATGQLGVSGDGTQRTKFGDSGDGVTANARAFFGDGLNFTISGADASTVTDIGVSVALDGIFTNSSFGGNFLQNQLQFGDGYFLTKDGFDLGPNQHQASGWVSYSFSPDTANHIVFTGVYALTGAAQHIDLSEQLGIHSGNGDTSDFAHTAAFSLNLPGNVNFTSDSGVFLTGLAAPGVPEPASWALLIVGFGVTGAIVRRRRRTIFGLIVSA